jgi:hypothetical protein
LQRRFSFREIGAQNQSVQRGLILGKGISGFLVVCSAAGACVDAVLIAVRARREAADGAVRERRQGRRRRPLVPGTQTAGHSLLFQIPVSLRVALHRLV